MKQGIYRALVEKWWGIVIAYAILLPAVYAGIWTVAEPIGIPDTISPQTYAGLPAFLKTRIGLHLLLTFFVTGHITLFFEVVVRRAQWRVKRVLYQGKFRILDLLKNNLSNLQRDLERELKSPDRPPLKSFKERIISEFISLRDKLHLFRELAEGPVASDERDEQCIAIINKIEALQTMGDKITSCVENAGVTVDEYIKAIDTLKTIFPNIEEAARLCLRKGPR